MRVDGTSTGRALEELAKLARTSSRWWYRADDARASARIAGCGSLAVWRIATATVLLQVARGRLLEVQPPVAEPSV